jgi:hypothetical protein
MIGKKPLQPVALPRMAPVVIVLLAPVAGCLMLWIEPRHEALGVLGGQGMLAAGVIVTTLACLRPAIALMVLIPLGPVALAANLATTGAAAAIMQVSLLVTVIVALQTLTRSRPLQPAHLWIALLAGSLVIGFHFPALGSLPAPAASTDLTRMLVGLALLAVVVAAPPRPGAVARAIALTGMCTACYALVFGEHADGRLAALGFNPNYLGGLLALPCVAAVGLTHRGRRPGWLVAAAACLIAIAQTQSRGAFLAAAAGVAVVLIQGRPLRPRTLVVIVGAALALYGGLGRLERLVAGGRQPAELAHDTDVRSKVADFALQVAARHPVRGIGLGRFPSCAAADPRFGVYMATHNDYLRLAAEVGGIALIALLALLWLGTRGRPTGDLAVLRAVTVAYAVGLFFANPLANLVASTPFWLSLGCLLAARADSPNGKATALATQPNRKEHKDDDD